ncbi:PilZ domain-containing protein [Pseudooctadecabacter sp.]|uniref:PilZ domain-containing protein n=1 Tax=Pseudooctadecabacter sp. TaxID=1966338 RepID=UPI0035C79C5E
MKYRAHRFPTRFPVTVRLGAVGYKSLVTSISASGACLSVGESLAVGQSVEVSYSGGRQTAKVCWANGDKAGVTFARPLGKSELDRIRFGCNRTGSAGPRRVGYA